VDDFSFGLGTSVGLVERVAVVEGDIHQIRKMLDLLINAGVRLGAGESLMPVREKFQYFDETPEPDAMLPIPAIMACESPDLLRAFLELLRLRPVGTDGIGGAILVHVPEIVRDLRAQRPWSAREMESVVGGQS
jgi:hypothetical protein